MRRKAAAVLLVAALGGCTSVHSGPETGGNGPHWGPTYGPPTVPGVKGPHGESVAMAAPYDFAPPGNAYLARQMMNQSIPLSAVQMNNPMGGMPGIYPGGMPPGAMMPTTAVPQGPFLSPPGVPFGPGVPAGPNGGGGPGLLPGMPRGMVPTGGFQPGNMPMPGGLINANIAPGKMPAGGIMQAQMAQANAAAGIRFMGQRTQIRFVRPSGMKVSWFTQGADGMPCFSTTPIEAPGRYNFPQAAIYRLKLSNIEGRPGLEIYPTMEVVPCNPKTEAFLAHSAVPIDFTNEDFKQIVDGNYLVKVIYLPDPQFQDVAGTGTDEILSTRLDPGADPIQEALRRGSILVVLRMGNVDQEAPNTPPLNAPGPHAGAPLTAPGLMAQTGPGIMPPASAQALFWAAKSGMPAPGMLNVPGAPPPVTGGPVPVPPLVAAPPRAPLGAREASQGALPGNSSTSKFQDTTAPVTPAVPDSNGPDFQVPPGNIQAPALPSAAGLLEGLNLSGTSPLPMNQVPEAPPLPAPAPSQDDE